MVPVPLTADERERARGIVLQAARKMLAYADEIHYTQGSLRWEGIAQGLRVVKGEFPKHADCSSTTTWMLWNAFTHVKGYSVLDSVNGYDWRYGNTASQRQHGRVVVESPLIVGDLCHYGAGDGKHVAIYIGGGYVFSHGSEGGPYKLPVRYRADFDHARRYIRAI